jgi:hypothetical protein
LINAPGIPGSSLFVEEHAQQAQNDASFNMAGVFYKIMKPKEDSLKSMI